MSNQQFVFSLSPEVAQRRQKLIPEEDDDILNMLNAEEETHIEQLHDLVADMLCFKHPIVFDDNIDLRKLGKEGQLKKNKTKQKRKKPQSQKTTRNV